MIHQSFMDGKWIIQIEYLHSARRAIIEDPSSESEPKDLSITEIDHSNPSLPSHITPCRNALQEKESDTVQSSLLDIQENSLENRHTSNLPFNSSLSRSTANTNTSYSQSSSFAEQTIMGLIRETNTLVKSFDTRFVELEKILQAKERLSISRKDNRRREERILRVCMHTFIYCGILKLDIHNLHRVLNTLCRSEKSELQLLRSVIYQNPPRPSGEK